MELGISTYIAAAALAAACATGCGSSVRTWCRTRALGSTFRKGRAAFAVRRFPVSIVVVWMFAFYWVQSGSSRCERHFAVIVEAHSHLS
jgi:hypothetical protein